MNKKVTHILLTALMLSLLGSCGVPITLGSDLVIQSETAVRQFSTTDTTFDTLVKEFEQVGKVQTGDADFEVGDIPVNFGDTENENYQGVCFEYTDGTKEVIIRQEWWDSVSDVYKRSLLFHELGHCRLGRDHLDDTYDVDGKSYKVSMMNSVIVRPTVYNTYSDEYHTELFTQDTTALFESLDLTVE